MFIENNSVVMSLDKYEEIRSLLDSQIELVLGYEDIIRDLRKLCDVYDDFRSVPIDSVETILEQVNDLYD